MSRISSVMAIDTRVSIRDYSLMQQVKDHTLHSILVAPKISVPIRRRVPSRNPPFQRQRLHNSISTSRHDSVEIQSEKVNPLLRPLFARSPTTTVYSAGNTS